MALQGHSSYKGSETKGHNADDSGDENKDLLNRLSCIMVKTQQIFGQMKGLSSQLNDPVKKIDCVSKTLQRQFLMMQEAMVCAYDLPEYDQENSAAKLVPIARIRALVLNIKKLSVELGKPIAVLQKLVSEMQTFSEKSLIKKYRRSHLECVRDFAEQLFSITDKFVKPVNRLDSLIAKFQGLTDNMQIYIIAKVQDEKMGIWHAVVRSLLKTSDILLRLKQLVETLSYKVNWFACKCQAFILLLKPHDVESSDDEESMEGEDKCDHADKWVWAEPRLNVSAQFTMICKPCVKSVGFCVDPM
ncbi:uncharacterized protein [Penaeus vannamei]|uniref:uncharacterized protein n=1 Tax=Penaeus vannamei TaxID=6689 RepID=UPI00387FA607